MGEIKKDKIINFPNTDKIENFKLTTNSEKR